MNVTRGSPRNYSSGRPRATRRRASATQRLAGGGVGIFAVATAPTSVIYQAIETRLAGGPAGDSHLQRSEVRDAFAGHLQRASGEVDESALLQRFQPGDAEPAGQMQVAGSRLRQRD